MSDRRRDPIHDSLESGILLVDALASIDLSDAAREATARHDFPDHLTMDDLRTRPRLAAAAIAGAVDDRRLVEEILRAALNRRSADTELVVRIADVREVHARSHRNVALALGTLGHRQEWVLRRRFGVNCRPATLAEIAEDLGVTPSRVREIEVKAFRILKHPRCSGPLRRHLELLEAPILDHARDGTNFVSEDRIDETFARLEPMTRLAATVFGYGPTSHLGRVFVENADRVDGGWYLDGRDSHVRTRMTGEFLGRIADLPFPRPLSTLVPYLPGGATMEDAAGWLVATKGWRLEGGYVFQGDRRLIQDVRAARIHSLASRTDHAVVGTCEVASLYGAGFPDDALGPGSDTHRTRPVPHLFEKVGSNGIAPVCVAPSGPSMGPDWSTDGSEQDDRDPTSHRAVVFDLLARGPMTQEAIADAVARRSTKGEGFDPKTILMGYDAFARYAPGVWARRDAMAFPEGSVLPGAMTDAAAIRRYATAAHGGCGRGFFPGWTADHERRLVQAASRLGDPDLMASLLLACDPSTWPAPDRTKALWGDAKERTQAWRIGTPAPSLGRRFPDPSTVMACLAHVVDTGGIGVFAVNDIAGTRVDGLGAADTLAFLTAIGAVDATMDWQAEHRATPEAARILRELRDEAASVGRLDWKCDGPMVLIEAALDFVSCSVWFDDDELMDRIATELHEVAPRSRPGVGAVPIYGMGG